MKNVNFNEAKLEEYKKQAKELVAQMTLDEKCSQLINWAPAVERLGIKGYNWWNEALHGVARAGVATVFPQAITMAGSFDDELIKEVGTAVSTEGRAKFNNQQKFGDTDIYKGLTFWAPNINIFRDPRWGRGHETFGEDPYLTSKMGSAYIDGIQGDDENNLKAAACTKHFAVHSGPEDIRHSFDAKVNKKDLYETYLYAFKKCISDTQVEAVMGAYNRVNGEPCCGSKTLLKDILRDEFGFKGHVTSDCWAIKDFFEGHKVCDTALEAVAMAMNNGCDLNCGNIYSNMRQCVDEGLVSESRIDEALVNLFTTRFKLGIMNGQSTKYDGLDITDTDTLEFRKLNEKVALSSMILLKNDGVLPLKKNELKTIAVIGPNADNRRALVGNYEGTSSRYETLLLGLQDYLQDDVRILYSQGCHLFSDKVEGLGQPNDREAELKGICEAADVVILSLGLDSGLEGEEGDQGNAYASGDKPSLKLPGLQEQVLNTVLATGKKVIVVLQAGSAIDLSIAKEKAAAIVYAGYPGAMGGYALTKLIFGDANFQGKLPITFYNSTEELPKFTDYNMTGRTYRYMTQPAQYPFGFGLSYSDIEVTDAKLSTDRIDPSLDGDLVDVTVSLKNCSELAGTETIQIYVSYLADNMPKYQLKSFKKVALAKGEQKTVTLSLSRDAFETVTADGEFVIGKGKYNIYVGTQQPDEVSAKLTGKKPVVFELNA